MKNKIMLIITLLLIIITTSTVIAIDARATPEQYFTPEYPTGVYDHETEQCRLYNNYTDYFKINR